MKSVILRTGSGTIPTRNWTASCSPRLSVSLPVQEYGGSDKRNGCSPTSVSLHMELSRSSIRRVSSEPDIILRSGIERVKSSSKLGSRSFPARVPEEDDDNSAGSLTLMENPNPQNRRGYAGDWPQCAIPAEEIGFSGGGIGKNWNSGGGRGDDFSTGDFADRKKIGAYYKEILKSNPNNSLLLRNYGKYLQEVERDASRAEEYYGRAILASPGDGEVLSLYGNLIWEKERDEERAKSYFDQAVEASPDDCMVLGSYARFMWEATEDDDDDDDDEQTAALPSVTMVQAI